MNISIGIPLWIGNFKKRRTSTLLELIAMHGIDYVEVSIDYPWPQYRYSELRETIQKLLDQGVGIGLHAPWRDLAIASPYRDIREASLRIIARSIEPVLEIGKLLYIVVHPTTHQRVEIAENRKDILESFKESLVKLSKLVEGRSPVILVENLSRGFGGDLTSIVDVVASLNNVKVGICLDVGHLATYYKRYVEGSGYYSSFNDYLDDVVTALSSLNNQVPLVHLHDIDGSSEHLLPGEGVLDFKHIYKKIWVLKPRYVLYEVFRSKKKRISIEDVLSTAGAGKAWIKVYAP